MNRNFNASISVLGIKEPKVQQAILKLLENSLFQKELLGKTSDTLTENIRRLRQQMSNMKFEIDPEKAQQIADMISEVIGDSVREAKAASQSALQSASTATEKAESASEDAAEVARKLDDMEETIEEKAEQAASTAISQVTENVQHAVADAQSAAQGAQDAASAATNSAQNAANTAQQASNAAQQATNAVKNLAFRSLASATTYNATYDQYRKIATLPAVSSAAGASLTFFGSLGGWTESALRQVMVSICNRQSGTTYSALEAIGYCFRASLPASADICIYKESNDTFSVYLKGVKATYFKHNIGMIYNEQVTPVEDTFKTSTPTGTLVWNLLANCKIVATTDLLENYALANHNHDTTYQPKGSYAAANHNHDGVYAKSGDVTTAINNLKAAANTWSAAQTLSALLTANGKIVSKGTSGSWYQGRDLAAFKCQVATTGYVPTVSCKSNTGSWELGTYTENNNFHLVFITDANYNAGNNSPSVNIVVAQDGKIYGVTAPAADSNTNMVPTTAWVRSCRPYAEEHSCAIFNTDLGASNTAFAMAGLVVDTNATYNVRVLFRNTASTARTCVANGTSVSLAASVGATASRQFTVAGNGTFTVDNIATSVDVFITIWR